MVIWEGCRMGSPGRPAEASRSPRLFWGVAILRRLATFSSLVGGWLKVRRQVLEPQD